MLGDLVDLPRMRELADRYGQLRVIRAVTLYITIIPLYWLVSDNPVWLFSVLLTSGFVWSGFEISNMTFVFAQTPSPVRTRAISYLMAVIGMAIFFGACTGDDDCIGFPPMDSR